MCTWYVYIRICQCIYQNVCLTLCLCVCCVCVCLLLLDGSLGARNGYEIGRLEDKLGNHGSPTCEVIYTGAVGTIIGQEHKGLNHMFTFMNTIRLGELHTHTLAITLISSSLIISSLITYHHFFALLLLLSSIGIYSLFLSSLIFSSSLLLQHNAASFINTISFSQNPQDGLSTFAS